MSQILNAWEESFECEYSDWIIVIRANVIGEPKPSVMVALYDSQKTTIDPKELNGMTLRAARRYVREREEDYDKLQSLIEFPGYGGRW